MNESRQYVVMGIVRRAGYDLFQYCGTGYGISKSRKAEMLTEKVSPYFAEGTRRYFRSTVLSIREEFGGLFLRFLESQPAGPNGSKVYRAFLMDVSGKTHGRPSLSESHKTRAKAEKAFFEWFSGFDPEQAVIEMLERGHVSAESKARDHMVALEKLETTRGE